MELVPAFSILPEHPFVLTVKLRHYLRFQPLDFLAQRHLLIKSFEVKLIPISGIKNGLNNRHRHLCHLLATQTNTTLHPQSPEDYCPGLHLKYIFLDRYKSLIETIVKKWYNKVTIKNRKDDIFETVFIP